MQLHRQWLLPVLAAVCLLTAAAAEAATKDKTEKSFTVAAGGKLLVEADRGNITIKTGDTDKVLVEVRRTVTRTTDEKAEQILKDHELTIEQADGTVTVKGKTPKELQGWKIWGKANLNIEWDVTIPKKFNIDLKTAGGNVTVADLEGAARVQTAGGNINLAQVTGTTWAHTAGGDVRMAGGTDKIELMTSGGNIHLGEAGGNVLAKTAGGDVRLAKAKGDVVLQTSGGNIHTGEVMGSLDARTSGGNIDAILHPQPKSSYHLSTSGGNIDVQVPETAALDLDANTSAGQVHWELTLANPPKKPTSHVRSSINGGGSEMVLRTSGGEIHLRKI